MELAEKSMKKIIPKDFYDGNEHPVALTVGEIKQALARLPDDLPVSQDFGEGAMLVVVNARNENAALHFEPGDLECS